MTVEIKEPGNGERRIAGRINPETRPGTIARMFAETVERYPDRVALMHKNAGAYRTMSYRELERQVRHFGQALLRRGVVSGDRIAILSENRPEWAIADLAVLSIGAVTTAIYTTLTVPQIRHILSDSGAKMLLVSDERLMEKALAIRDELPELRLLVLIDLSQDDPPKEGVLLFREMLAEGETAPAGIVDEYERRRQSIEPDDLASLIYTSGTTGDPKGAMLTHGNFHSNATVIPSLIHLSENDRFLSFLPLCHVFERLGGHYLPLSVGAAIAYSESLFTVQKNMEEVRPTIMLSVPRLYESMQSRIVEAAAKAPPVKRRLFNWALRAGRSRNLGKIDGRWNPWHELQYMVADRLVLAKIRERVGGRLRYFVSGGAPLPRGVAEFFHSLGIIILEGYGLTETSPVISVTLPESIRVGTVGPPLPGVEVRIADDGEILARGPLVMKGYYHRPEETHQVIDPDGWFHTGDIGRLDEMGRLSITDRKKDIIVLANGKNVAPQPIETAIKASRYINEVALIGDRRNVITALVVPDFHALREWAKEHSLEHGEAGDLARNPEVRRLVKTEIDRLTESFADFERIRRFTLLDHDWTVDNGMLTPTLKVKRRIASERYRDQIAAMYGGEGNGDIRT